MATVEASVEIPGPLADVWDLYFDRDRWAAWVDGFASVVAESGGYPARGSELRWRSTPAGRGEVRERVVAHEPRTLHRVEFEDPSAKGDLETLFEMVPASGRGRVTKVSQRLDYRLTSGGFLAPVTDVLFIRSQQRQSLQRSLIELRLEADRTGAGTL